MSTKTSLKTYVLKSHTESSAPHFIRVNRDQRVQFQKRPIDHAYLQQTFTFEDAEGTQQNKTARLKLNSNTIWQDEQIKMGIPANAPFTQAERDAVRFTNGVLMTNKKIVQTFLEAVPQFEGFKGERDGEVKEALYELFDKTEKLKSDNKEFLKRVKGAAKIAELYENEDAKAMKDLMIRLNGAFFKAPDDIEELLAQLTNYVDDADEAMLDKLLDDTMTQDEALVILVGKAVNADIISFDKSQNQVSLKKNNSWVDVKMISSNIEPSERQRLFVEFIASPDGKYIAEDLKARFDGEGEGKKKPRKEQLV